ncbi:MAG: calcium-binding protein, partial [Candidatus Puniceispirillaceae bacterium]
FDFDHETQSDYQVTIRITEEDDSVQETIVTLSITDLNDVPPNFGDAPATVTIDEGAAFSQSFAAIPDIQGASVTYSLVGEDADRFTIDATGLVTAPAFDADADDAKDSYALTVIASTGSGEESQDYDLTVTVTPLINLPPLINDLDQNDAETGTQSRATIEGTAPASGSDAGDTADTLVGTAAAEIIYGYGGDDTITTNGGIDVVIGGAGDDTITLGGTREQIIYQIDTAHDVWRTPDGSDVIHNFNFHALDSNDGSLDRLFFVDKSVVLAPDEDKAFDGTGSFLQALIEGGGGLRFDVADASLPEAAQVIDKILITFGADEDGDESNGATLTLNLETDLDLVSSTLIRATLGTGLAVTADNYEAAEAIFEAAGNPFSWIDDDDLPTDLVLV